MNPALLAFPLAFTMVALFNLADAKETDTAKLTGALNPFGGIRAGNTDGSIPPWEGGLKPGAAAISNIGNYADPFAQEKPVYIINSANFSQHKDLLSPGQQAMFKRFPEYRMNVYPSHRSARLPQKYIDESRTNVTKVELAQAGNGLKNYNFGIPFPEPTEALEVMWNHLTRFRGGSVNREFASATVQGKSDYTLVTYEQRINWRETVTDLAPEENILQYTLVKTLSPSRYAGEATLVYEPLDQVEEQRSAWQYMPGQRRVRRAPTVAYDSSARYSFGQVVSDSIDGFNGAPDRYDWKLIGRKEMLIGYNAFKLGSKDIKYSDILQPNFANPDLTRYEKHRVWVVEATLKPNARHIYSKRRFYVDEDTWQIMASDMYDSRGELWRNYESHLTFLHDIELPLTALETTYDLISGNYSANFMTNEVSKKMQFGASGRKADYTPAELKRQGK
ncbi:DUF1329 domain-containing protein [Pseudomonas sp. NPDC087639]|uniref:DUF1329 domain-containing protein n=1 Tax=Pseudomonas sp. NPDC087639 TaxID=3364445 RepID=UPI0038177663